MDEPNRYASGTSLERSPKETLADAIEEVLHVEMDGFMRRDMLKMSLDSLQQLKHMIVRVKMTEKRGYD